MKLKFIIKWLRYLENPSDRESGFIRVTLLITLAIVGVFGSIHLTRFISEKIELRQTLAACDRKYQCFNRVIEMNRIQQVLYLKKQNFSTDPQQLDLEFPIQTEDYKYEITGIPSEQPTAIANLATPIIDEKKAYLGLVFATVKNGDRVTMGKICESENPTGKNPTWEGLPTQSDEENFNCTDITVGGQQMVDLGLLSFSRVGEEESE